MDREPEQQNKDDDGQQRRQRSGMESLNAGYVILASVLVGLGLGYLIDEWAQTTPLWTVILAAAFIVAGLYQVVRDQW